MKALEGLDQYPNDQFNRLLKEIYSMGILFNRSSVLSLAILFLALLASVGCGYRLGFKQPPRVFKLAVPMFENIVMPLRREIEFDLTRAVRQELELRTDFKLVSTEHADAVLYGRIERVSESVLTEGARDVIQDASLSVGVRIRLVRMNSRISGASNSSPRQEELLNHFLSDSSAYTVLAGETVGDARAEAINEIAEKIVESLEAW